MKNKQKKQVKDEEPAALAGWEDEGGAALPDRGQATETQRHEGRERTGRRAAFDATHDSSARGEHRYPDVHQTEAERRARQSRDDLKRKLGRTR